MFLEVFCDLGVIGGPIVPVVAVRRGGLTEAKAATRGSVRAVGP